MRFKIVVFFLFMSGCAYRLGAPERTLPRGFRSVSIPVFKNTSSEPGVEVFFTNALINVLQRSKVARVDETNQSDIMIEGTVNSIGSMLGTANASVPDSPTKDLPRGALISPEYRVTIIATVKIFKKSDHGLIWSGTFKGERTYEAALVYSAGINTVNPLYDQSARMNTIALIAQDMMSEAHDKMTENF